MWEHSHSAWPSHWVQVSKIKHNHTPLCTQTHDARGRSTRCGQHRYQRLDLDIRPSHDDRLWMTPSPLQVGHAEAVVSTNITRAFCMHIHLTLICLIIVWKKTNFTWLNKQPPIIYPAGSTVPVYWHVIGQVTAVNPWQACACNSITLSYHAQCEQNLGCVTTRYVVSCLVCARICTMSCTSWTSWANTSTSKANIQYMHAF